MKKITLSIAILLLSTAMAFAQCFVCEKASSDNYGERALYRMVRGLGNTLFGWMEIFFRPVKETNKGTPFAAAVTVGLGNAITRTVNGVTEVITFWNPGKEDIVITRDCPICTYK